MKDPLFRPQAEGADNSDMDGCAHGMDSVWCYLCRVETRAEDPRSAWGLSDWSDEELDLWEDATGPMPPEQAAYLRFLCEEFKVGFDPTFTEGEAALVIDSFLKEAPSASQMRTLDTLARRTGEELGVGLSYATARAAIRRLVALQGLRAVG
jgi:hypothetical protein